MVWHSTFSTWPTGQNTSNLLKHLVEKSWDTVTLLTLHLFIELNPLNNILFSSIVMGKAEGHGSNWHGHVTALSVAPDYRRLGLAAKLMSGLEEISEK